MTKNNLVEVLENKYLWFLPPKRTKKECINSSFLDKHYHRIGVYKGDRPTDGGLDGWSLKSECVDCGRQFRYNRFLPITAKIEAERKKETMDEKAVTGWTPC